jgi:hypothetical protein
MKMNENPLTLDADKLARVRAELSLYCSQLHAADFMLPRAEMAVATVDNAHDSGIVFSDLDAIHEVLVDYRRRQKDIEEPVSTTLNDAIGIIVGCAESAGLSLSPKIECEEDAMAALNRA